MNAKDLTDLGIAEDVAQKVIVLHGKDIEAHKTTITTLQGQYDTATGQLTEANKAIESFKAMKPDELKAAADDYKAKYEQATQEATANLAKVKFDYALDNELKNTYKVKDEVAVKARLKLDAIQYKDDKFIGLKEQIDPLKSEREYLFESDKQTPRIVSGGGNPSANVDALTAGIRQGAGLTQPQGK